MKELIEKLDKNEQDLQNAYTEVRVVRDQLKQTAEPENVPVEQKPAEQSE